MKIAIIGSGIAGLGALWALRDKAEITLYEKNERLGGHTHTVTINDLGTKPVPVDTGFIVYNEATYPNLIHFFAALGIQTEISDMSFAVSMKNGSYEYSSDNLRKLMGGFANYFSLAHWQMVVELLRFMRSADKLCAADAEQTLGEFLKLNKFGNSFIERHLAPMGAAIWSMDAEKILDFPAASFGRFFRNHGLLEPDIKKRPLWRTVTGGSQCYIDAIMAQTKTKVRLKTEITRIAKECDGVVIKTKAGDREKYDQVIIATHADEASLLLSDDYRRSRALLSNIKYSCNSAYLHRDASLMPRRKSLWASWNYMQPPAAGRGVYVSYWMNRLQNLHHVGADIFVTLSPSTPPVASKVWKQMIYHHPQFDRQAMAMQSELKQIQGIDGLWFCGSYFGYGFHEDALASGLAVAEALGAKRPWVCVDASPAFANATPMTKHA